MQERSSPQQEDDPTSQESNNDLLLPCWAPITTRLLQEANCSSWYAMDHVMTEPNFVSTLRQELESNGVLQRLKAAKTTGERQTNEVLSLLQQNGLFQAPTAPSSSVRGDKSAFLGRGIGDQYPHVHSLIQKLEATAQQYLGEDLEFDFTKTSVQLAEFPGDGISGYPRHCDRSGNLCRQEKSTTTNSSERLLTGVYYLTPEDWNETMDGGCLRLFGDNTSQYTDVVPYSNRMIVFRSDGVEHEVRPSVRRPRLALTIWLYGKMNKGEMAKKEAAEESKTTLQNQNGNITSPNISTTTGPPPLPLKAPLNDDTTTKTIFVSIAAYRDSETGPTIRHLKAMATHPQRVFVGLMLQLDSQHDQAILQGLPTDDPWYQSNARVLQLEARHALGPCYTRALCQSLHRSEDYVLQIDSHMRFRKHWDSYLIQELEPLQQATRTDNCMLTAYPVGYQLPNEIPNETRGTLLVPWKLDSDGMLRQRGRLFQSTDDKPILCHLYAAGFNFARSTVLRDCPYDGSLHHLFFGEELSMAVRLYCQGYDLYAPAQSVCYHLWSRDHRPTPASSPTNNKEREECQKRSMEVVRQQLLGTTGVRTAQQFAEALGVDFVKGIVHTSAQQHPIEFVDDSTNFAPASLEAKVQALDPSAQDLIAAFLQQVSSS